MKRQPQGSCKRLWQCCLAGALVMAGQGAVALGQAPSPLPLPPIPPVPPPIVAPWSQSADPAKTNKDLKTNKDIKTASATQNGEVLPVTPRKEGQPGPEPVGPPAPVSAAMPGGCATCGHGGSGCCIPGRYHDCCGCNGDTPGGRVLCAFYEELCCPDPCYEGKWIPAANAAFFVEGTRPVTTTRIRWDYIDNYTLPDRSEMFWAGSGGTGGGKGPPAKETSLTSSQLSLYQEIAAKGFSFFIDIPYLTVDPEINPLAAGFGDMELGTKTLLFDRDLFQIGFMFKTILPVGNVTRGLGTGHVSLEPSLLGTLKITPDTYMQAQLSEWVPLGADTTFQGSVFHYHFSLNHVLCRPVPDVQVIGTAEFVGYSFEAGEFSDPASGTFLPANNTSYFTLGPGIRLVICEWLDFGFGAAFNLGDRGPGQEYRTEMRIRY